MRRVACLIITAALLAVGGSAASAHTSGCHSAHSCPSDHHTYVWYDAAGQGWDCVKPGAPEQTAADTTVVTFDGYTYYCHAAGASAPPQPTDSDGDGVADSADACPTTFALTPNGCPAAPAPLDSDGDGVSDGNDVCPSTAAATADGCPVPVVAPQPYSLAPVSARCKVRGSLPDRRCTPGATFHVTARQVCKRGYSRRVRNVSESVKDRVYASYGITKDSAATYEMDHLISLELGGSNSIKNLFPEAATPRPGFHEKDKLENRLHALVCSGRMSLRTAQRRIRQNWIAEYKRQFRR